MTMKMYNFKLPARREVRRISDDNAYFAFVTLFKLIAVLHSKYIHLLLSLAFYPYLP